MTRRQPAAILAIALCVAACSPRGASPNQPESRRDAPAPRQAPAASSSTAGAFAFTFVVRIGTVARDPRIVRTEEGPCGDVAVARVRTMPIDDKVLVADPVVEFDAAGKEIAHWGIPNGAEVVALDGGRLQFLVDGKAYWTDATGRIDDAGAAAAAPDKPPLLRSDGMFACPQLPTFPSDEGAQQCFRVTDAAGKERTIAIEGVCS